MSFADYYSSSDVGLCHEIRIVRSPFVRPVASELSGDFRSELDFTLRETPLGDCRPAVCESLIYPLLREVWKPFHGSLTLWNHVPLCYDEDLTGEPDFIVARRSPLGPFVLDQPYCVIVRAEEDDHQRAWGQCLAAMRAAQRLNDTPERVIHGVATDGRAWEFGRLQADQFTQNVRQFALGNLDQLATAVHFLLIQCRDEAARMPVLT